MNKQELIEKLKQHGAWCTECHDINGEIDRYVKVSKVRELLDQLDEPEKPEVSQFVADWFEQHKDILDYSIWEACVNSRADYDDLEGTTGNEFYDWLINAGGEDGKHERITLLVHMQDGYTIKKEPTWVVKNANGKYFVSLSYGSVLGTLRQGQIASKRRAYEFPDKAKAEAVATLVEGSVEAAE